MFGKVIDPGSKKNIASSLPIGTEVFTLHTPTTEFSENGHGYTLFFKIIKYCLYALLVSIVPLSIILMIMFHSGDDCAGEMTGEETKGKFKGNETSHAMNQIRRYAMMHDFHIDLNPLDDIFEDRDGDGIEVSEMFGQTIEFFSGNYLRRFFAYVCRDEDDTEFRNLKENYREFCMKYYFDICDQRPKSKPCMDRAMDFYKKTNVHFSCARTWINLISLSNRIEKADRHSIADAMLPYLYQAIFYFLLIGTLVFQWWHEKFRLKLKQEARELDDISLLLSELPCGEKYTGVDLKKKILDSFEKEGYKIKKIVFAFDIEEFVQLKEEYKELKTTYEKKKYKQRNNLGETALQSEHDELLDKDLQKIQELDKKIKKFEQDFDNRKIELMVGKAFIMFSSSDERNECFEKYRVDGFWNNFFDYFYEDFMKFKFILKDVKGEDIRIQVEDSYEPQDVIWESLKYGYIQKFFRESLSSIIGYIVVISGFFGLYYMKTNQVSEMKVNILLKRSLSVSTRNSS